MENKKENQNILSIIGKLLYYTVIVFVCAIVVFLIYYIISAQIHANDEDYKPPVSIYTIVSPSMTPNINVYDVVINTKVNNPKDIQVGDIITYKSAAATSEGMTITHRVIEVAQLPDGTYEYMTQGDNNGEPDSLYVTFDNIIGKEVLIIPYLGKIQFFIANQKGWLFLLLVPVSIYLIREVFKLIDLLGLRRKVNKVIGTTEDNLIDRMKAEKQKQEELKAQIKEDLIKNEVKKDAIIRNPKEPSGFLERYTETIVSVSNNKYYPNSKKEKNKEVYVEYSEEPLILPPTKVDAKKVIPKEEKEKEIILPKVKAKPVIVNEEYDILETDELTSKIKEYDEKIEKLDKMLKDIEEINKLVKPDEKEKFEEEENFLTESKIKVIKIEDTKNKKREKKNNQHKNQTKEIKKEINLDVTGLIPINHPLLKKAAAEMEELFEEETATKKEKKVSLKLNPKEIKKINRRSKSTNKPKEKKLNLNPKEIKKVNRPGRKKTVNSSDNITKTTSKKPKLIVIEKNKKR